MNARLASIRDTSAQDQRVAVPAASRRRRFLIIGAVAAVALLLLVLLAPMALRMLGGERSISIDRLRIATVERGTLVRDASVQGRVVAAVSPTLYAPVAGIVTLHSLAGQAVAEGDLLAVIESPELDNELQRERATLQELEVEVQRQRIASDRQKLVSRRSAADAQVTLSSAEREMARAEAAFEKGAMSEVDYRRAKDTLATAEIAAAYAGDDTGLEVQAIQFELETRELQLARQRLVVADLERQVQELSVRSPVDGMIGNVAVVNRAVVATNSPILTVVDLSQLEVELAVPESYADDIGIGMSAEVQIGTLRAPGTVSAISPEVIGNQVPVRVAFEGAQPEGLRQNQRVSARVIFEELPDVLTVSRGPFVDSGGGRYAYVLDGDTAVRTPIQLGATSVSQVEVLDGLAVGDRVVVGGSDHFEDAEAARVIR